MYLGSSTSYRISIVLVILALGIGIAGAIAFYESPDAATSAGIRPTTTVVLIASLLVVSAIDRIYIRSCIGFRLGIGLCLVTLAYLFVSNYREGFIQFKRSLPAFAFASICLYSFIRRHRFTIALLIKKTPPIKCVEGGPVRTNGLPPSPYPQEIEFVFAEADSVALNLEGEVYELSMHVPADDPAGADILKVANDSREFLVHTNSIYEAFLGGHGRFMSDLSQSERDSLQALPMLKCQTLDDSRSPSIARVSNQEIPLEARHQGMEFFVFSQDGAAYFIVDTLYDKDANQVPRILGKIPTESLLANSAKFDVDDEQWVWV